MKTESFGELSGQDWEDICNKLFHARYKDNYQDVPARYGGDYGIEGFTIDGDLFQCYSPENEEFSSKSLYELQRDKITKDINKLIKNISEISKLNKNTPIKNWHFVTPKYDSKDLVQHCRNKEEEIQKSISQYVTKDFTIILQTENSYVEELQYVVNSKYFSIKSIDKILTDEDLKSISESKNEIIEKIRTKLLKLDSIKNDNEKLNKWTFLVFKYFIIGQEQLEVLNKSYPDTYKKITRLKNSVERTVEQKSLLGLNLIDLQIIQKEYKEELEKDFISVCEISLLGNLAQEAIADWMVRCPIDFE